MFKKISLLFRLLLSIVRIRRMEYRFDALLASVNSDTPLDQKKVKTLMDYYENGRWLRDYELDEAGLLPASLKRGVLSEDGVWNLLSGIDTPAPPGVQSKQ